MIQFSYSALKDFNTCPRKYAEVRVKKNYIPQEHESAVYGKEVHKAFEDYIKAGIDIPKNYEKSKKLLDVLLEIPGVKHCEYELAIDENKQPCGFTDDTRWARGIIDLLILGQDTAFILDYKTGKSRYADTKQLKLLALLTFAKFPYINHIRAALLFIGENRLVPAEYGRHEMDKLWGDFAGDLKRLEHSYAQDWWPTSPSGLCKQYCPVLSCEFNGG
jgi:hypothetical protein